MLMSIGQILNNRKYSQNHWRIFSTEHTNGSFPPKKEKIVAKKPINFTNNNNNKIGRELIIIIKIIVN